jgi:Helix-turn-helix domain
MLYLKLGESASNVVLLGSSVTGTVEPPTMQSEASIEGNPAPKGTRGEQLRDAFGLLSPADLESLLGVDERTLGVWRGDGKGPACVRLGRAIFYRREDVAAWKDASAAKGDKAPDAR